MEGERSWSGIGSLGQWERRLPKFCQRFTLPLHLRFQEMGKSDCKRLLCVRDAYDVLAGWQAKDYSAPEFRETNFGCTQFENGCLGRLVFGAGECAAEMILSKTRFGFVKLFSPNKLIIIIGVNNLYFCLVGVEKFLRKFDFLFWFPLEFISGYFSVE